jgi:hypothetical protein
VKSLRVERFFGLRREAVTLTWGLKRRVVCFLSSNLISMISIEVVSSFLELFGKQGMSQDFGRLARGGTCVSFAGLVK